MLRALSLLAPLTLVALAACGSDDTAISEPPTTVRSADVRDDDPVVGDLDQYEDQVGTTISITLPDGQVVEDDDATVTCGRSDEVQRFVGELEAFGDRRFRVVSDQQLPATGRNDGGPSRVTVIDLSGEAGPWTTDAEVEQGSFGPVLWFVEIITPAAGAGDLDVQVEVVVDLEIDDDVVCDVDDALFADDVAPISPSSG